MHKPGNTLLSKTKSERLNVCNGSLGYVSYCAMMISAMGVWRMLFLLLSLLLDAFIEITSDIILLSYPKPLTPIVITDVLLLLDLYIVSTQGSEFRKPSAMASRGPACKTSSSLRSALSCLLRVRV